jgi:carbamoyl-phosphate synthase small subunit
MSGYQEMVTDLSFAGQILVFTQPQIGNYGWHSEESEAVKILVRGLVVRELSAGEGSLHAQDSLEDICRKQRICGLKKVDTRALTRHLRHYGTLYGVLATEAEAGLAYWRERNGDAAPEEPHWVYQATCREPYEIPGEGPLLAVLDFGIKYNILRLLSRRGFRLRVFPAGTKAEEILACHPQGMVLSNGPGDPAGLPEIAANLAELLPRLPILGICLGHQMLAMAAGARTFKLPFGHRGGNHPVQDLRTGRTTITSQNHGYAVERESLRGSGFAEAYRHLNDHTVEGLVHEHYPVLSIQFHPEGAPGPEENAVILDDFVELLHAAHKEKEGDGRA